MSEVKRFSGNYIPGHPPAIVTDPNGLLCLYSELDAERLSHEKTKADLADTKMAYKLEEEEYAILEAGYHELEKRLAELEDAIEQSTETGKDALWWEIPWVENQTIQQAILNSQTRKSEAIG